MKTVHGKASITHLVEEEMVRLQVGIISISLSYEEFADLALAFRQGEECGFPFPEKEDNPFEKEFAAILKRHKEITTGTIKL